MSSRASKQYLQQPLRKNLWKFIFGSNQLPPPLGILTGQKQPEKSADLILMILCFDYIGLGIWEHIAGFLGIPKNLVSVKDITAQELT